MSNILNRLTNNYLKLNKKRTIVTIIGIILSGAMISAVATLAVSFQGFLIRSRRIEQGDWEAKFIKVKYEDSKYIKENENFKDYVLEKEIGTAPNKYSNEPEIKIMGYPQNSINRVGMSLQKGEMPKNDKEIALSESFFDGLENEPQIGDMVTFKMNGENKNYKVTGIIKRPVFESSKSNYTAGITEIDESQIQPDDLVTIGINVKKTKTIYNDVEELAKKLDLYKEVVKEDGTTIKELNIDYNNILLAYMGVNNGTGFDAMLISVCGILITIIVIGSVLVIYNSFAISVSERKKQFGMLSSIGATKRQIRKSVIHEATILGAIGIPIGILAGIGGIAVTLQVVNHLLVGIMASGVINLDYTIKLVISWPSIVLSILLIAATIYISAIVPARRASKITPIEAIRQTGDVKVKAKKVKTPKWIRKLFGIEGELALKNLKRSKKRYRTTVLSLIISIVLFIAVNGFMGYMFKGFNVMYQSVPYDYIVGVKSTDLEHAKEFTQSLLQTEGVTRSNVFAGYNGKIYLPEEQIDNRLLEAIKGNKLSYTVNKNPEGKYDINVSIVTMEDKEMNNYIEQLGIKELKDNQVILINYANMLYPDKIESNITKFKNNESIKVTYHTEEGEKEKEYNIAKVTDKMPYALENTTPELYLIVNKNEISNLRKILPAEKLTMSVAIESENTEALSEKQDSLMKNYHDMTVYGQSIKEAMEANRNLTLIISIFLYGFIVLISLIGIANIFNTISTNISLRRREFANLKSIGMTDKQFKHMLDLECVFYGTKALLYGIPIGILLCFLLNFAFGNMISFNFELPWESILIAIVAVYLIVFITMLYASKKVKKENIIDVLRDDNI